MEHCLHRHGSKEYCPNTYLYTKCRFTSKQLDADACVWKGILAPLSPWSICFSQFSGVDLGTKYIFWGYFLFGSCWAVQSVPSHLRYLCAV